MKSIPIELSSGFMRRVSLNLNIEECSQPGDLERMLGVLDARGFRHLRQALAATKTLTFKLDSGVICPLVM